MNVLVTGGAGYIGSVCAEQLLMRKYRVIVYDNLSAGHRAAVPRGAQFVRGDVGDAPSLARTFRRFKIDAVMHFAANILVEESVRDPAVFYRNNVAASLTLLEVMKEHGILNLVFSSSAAVYGEPQTIPIPEDHPKAPINPYGETKLVVERAAEWYHRAYGLKCVCLRYFNAAGATRRLGEDHQPETHLLPRILDAALDTGRDFILYGDDYPTPDGTCVRDFVHVADIALAHVMALKKLPKVGFAVYNVGLGRGYSLREVVKAVQEVTRRPMNVTVGPRRAGDPARLVASPEKICRELGWQPRYSDLRYIVRSAWNWKRKHPHGYGSRHDC
jgi:UDP-glucose 4-epimerase